MNTTDRYVKIRKALEMGPTPGSREVFDLGMWDVEVRSSSTSGTICQVNNKGTLFRASEDGADRVGRSQGRLLSDAFFIAACDPDTIRELLAERDALAAENERLREDRARFPDRPDDIGRMIEAHIGNLKAGKKSAEALADRAFDRAFRAEAALAEKDKEIAVLREALRGMSCPRPCNNRPDDWEVGQCFDAGECCCIAGVALAYNAGGKDVG